MVRILHVLAIASLGIGAWGTEFHCDSKTCFFSANDCRSETSGAPASIHSDAENAMAAQMASKSGGKLGLGGYYFVDDGLGWEDLSSSTYHPSGFSPTRSGFLVIDGAGSWGVVSFADRGSYRFLCKIPASDTTTAYISTTTQTTFTTTTAPTTQPSTTTTASTTVPSTTVLLNTTVAPTTLLPANTTTVPLFTNTTTQPLVTNATFATNTTFAPTNATFAPTNATFAPTNISTTVPATNATTSEPDYNATTEVFTSSENATDVSAVNETSSMPNSTSEVTSYPATPYPTAVTTPPVSNATNPLSKAFEKWTQTLIAFTSPLPLAVTFDGTLSAAHSNLVVIFDTDASCTSASREASPINFGNVEVGVFTFAPPPTLLNVFVQTTYHICVGNTESGETWQNRNATVVVIPFHVDFESTGFREIRTGNFSLVELPIPSSATAPFVIKLEVYSHYYFGFGSCGSETLVNQTPTMVDSRIYLVQPTPPGLNSPICVMVPALSLRFEVSASTTSFSASSRVSSVSAGHAVAISIGGSVPPKIDASPLVAWTTQLPSCDEVPPAATAIVGVSTKGYVFIYNIPASVRRGSFVCVAASGAGNSSVALVTGPTGPLTVSSSTETSVPLVVQQGTLTPIDLSPFISYSDAASDFDGYLSALSAIATPGTKVWLSEDQFRCGDSDAPVSGTTSIVQNSAVQWSTSAAWEGIAIGSYAMCYLGDDGVGKWARISVLVVNRLTGTMSLNQRILLGTDIYTSLITTGVTNISVRWSLGLVRDATKCNDATALVASGAFYQQGHFLFGSFGFSNAESGTYVLCGSTFGDLYPISKVDAQPQVELAASSVNPSNYLPLEWHVGDITQFCGESAKTMPVGIVFPLTKVMWSAVARFVSQTGFSFNSTLSAENFAGAGVPFFIPCPTCPAIAFPSLAAKYSGCVSAEGLLWAESPQYLTVASINQPTGSIRAAPHRSGVHVKLVSVDTLSVDLATANKVMLCAAPGSAADGFVTSSQTLRFVASSDLSSGRTYIACSRTFSSGEWLYAGVVSTLAGGGDGGIVDAASISLITGLAATVRIPSATNLSIRLEGSFPDTTAGAYSISFAFGDATCSRADADRLVARIPLHVSNVSVAFAYLDLALTALQNGTATICFHTGTVKIEAVPPSSTASLTGTVMFVFPTLRTINFLRSLTVPSGFSETYPLLVTDTDYTPGQIAFVEKGPNGTAQCQSIGPSVATVLVVDANTKTARLSPFASSVVNGTSPKVFQACISGRVSDTVRWFPSDFTLVVLPAGQGGVTVGTYALRMGFTNPFDALSVQFRAFVVNRVMTLDGKSSSADVLIGQVNSTNTVIVPTPMNDGTTNARTVELFKALVVSGGNLAFSSTVGDERLAVLETVSLFYLDGRPVAGFGPSRVGRDALTDPPTASEDVDYSTRAFLIFACIAIPVTLGVIGHAFLNKVTGQAAATENVKGEARADVSVIVSREEPSQAATEMSPHRTRDVMDVSSPVPEHPLRSAIGPTA